MSLLGLLYWLSRLIAIAAIIHVLLDNRQPAKTMAWALVIYFIPILGVIAYIFFGVNRRKERYISRRSLDQLTKRSMLGFVEQRDLQIPDEFRSTIDMFVNQSFSLPFNNNKVEVLCDGYQFFPRLLQDIAAAKSHIHIDIYIFEDDALGRLVSDALIAKARQGVEVRVVYDDVCCWNVSDRFFERMRVAGIEVEPFMPVRFPRFTSKANYRNHRKIFVIDGLVGYIGGMNIALRYVKGTGRQPWRDTMMRIEGRGVYSLQRAFLVDWYFVDRTMLSEEKYYPSQTSNLKPQTSNTSNFKLQTSNFKPQTSTLLQTVTSAPVSDYPEIMQGYIRIIMAAKKYIYIETPYFLPTMALHSALQMAAQSGVDVRLLVPLKSDARITEWASRSYLREAVDAGIRVSFYKAGFLHSKLLVSDDTVATCGSTNVDFRSFENNFEANTFFYHGAVPAQLKEMFLADEARSVSMHDVPGRMHRSFFVRLGESLARLFSPLL